MISHKKNIILHVTS